LFSLPEAVILSGMSIKNAFWIPAVALLVCAAPARAHRDPRAGLEEMAHAFGAEAGAVSPALVVVSTSSAGRERDEVRFEYPDVTKDLENLTRFVNKVVGKGKKRKVIPIRIDTGVTAGDRINQKLITHIVIHSSLGLAGNPAELARRDRLNETGAGKFDSCQSSINFLETKRSAAHFIVCRDGRVKQMAEMKDYADHVKDPEFVANSIGIETDTGYAKAPFFFPGSGDWDPNTRWRMYVSLAKLIRMIHKATDGAVALDSQHIMTHAEVDSAYCAAAGCHAHSDPGPYFISEMVPAFGGAAAMTTARENLMRLVTDKTSPKTTFISRPRAADGFQVVDAVGVSRIVLWKLKYSREQIQSMKQLIPTEPVVIKVSEWAAAAAPLVMPPGTKIMDVPVEPGEYQVEAQDLVGNRSYTDFTVAPAGSSPVGAIAASFRAAPERMAAAESLLEINE
jgi:N-acetyl-anhydromuramyl-L-alanine amidase AmpD